MNLHGEQEEDSQTRVAARLITRYLAPRWGSVLIAMVCAIVFAGTSALLLKILQPAVNGLKLLQPSAVAPPSLAAVLRWPLAMGGLVLVRAVVQVVQARITNEVGNGIVGDVQV